MRHLISSFFCASLLVACGSSAEPLATRSSTPPADPTEAPPASAPSDSDDSDSGLAEVEAGSGIPDASADASEPDGSTGALAADAGVPATAMEPSDGGPILFDLVSPARCQQYAGHLVHCAFDPLALEATATTQAAPVESTFTVTMSGDCSSQYPLALALSAAGAPTVLFHIEDRNAVVRRTDSGPIETINVLDGSPWTDVAAYDASCRISVSAQMNGVATP
jgi:hypothetical protein